MQQVTYRIDVDDVAEPGKGKDTFKIQTDSGYAAAGSWKKGISGPRPVASTTKGVSRDERGS